MAVDYLAGRVFEVHQKRHRRLPAAECILRAVHRAHKGRVGGAQGAEPCLAPLFLCGQAGGAGIAYPFTRTLCSSGWSITFQRPLYMHIDKKETRAGK
jgi:hypothetical protein